MWLGFSGQHRDGWIRMGLRRTDFVLDKEAVKLISSDIEQGLKKDMQSSLMAAKGETEPDNANDREESTNEVSSDSLIEAVPKDSVASDTNNLESPLTEENEAVHGDYKEETTEEINSEQSKVSGERDHSLSTKDRIEQQLAEKETKDKLSRAQHEKYMAEMRRLYPTLPEHFGQNDIEQAVAIKKDRMIDGQVFNNTWDLLSLSIHPDNARDGQVYVLWDPENTYVDQADYWIHTAWLSLKKPESMRTSSVAVVHLDHSSPATEGS